jgi:polyhydroxybutyrate depolymerase
MFTARNAKPIGLVLLLILAGATRSEQLGPGDHVRAVTMGDQERSYLVHVPPGYDHKQPGPVVLIFHGAGLDAARMVLYSGLSAKADQAGFIAVYPNGSGVRGLSWNAEICCDFAARTHVDDVGFVRAVLDDLEKVVTVDRRRVYATGGSNGAMLCYRLASELSERIAAIAPVAGTMASKTCHPSRPVPVIHFHGTNDQWIPYKGGLGTRKVNFNSVAETIQAWVQADGCRAEAQVTRYPDRTHDGTVVIRTCYSGGKNGSEVVLITIEGGGHSWPGRDWHPELLGKSTKNISANDLIWDFFSKH